MKKFCINLLCMFVPSRKKRSKIRKKFIQKSIPKHIQNYIDETNNNIENKFNTLLNNLDNIAFDLKQYINRNTEKKLSTAFMHQKTFTKFKGINTGKDIVILATGPSLNDFKPINNAIYIGVNTAYLYKKVKLDYFFIQDFSGLHNHIQNINEYTGNNCEKFYGLTTEFDSQWNRVVPESHSISAKALRYRTDWENDIKTFQCRFAYDISTQPLGCFGSVVFPALQFALWTNPKRIYIVGCDCSNTGHFDKSKSDNLSYLIEPWKKFKEFVQIYYPETEIISVNPVGLRGLFTDIDQKGKK